MHYEPQLAFFRQLLHDMNISSCVLSQPDDLIPPQIDLHLRAHLFTLENYASFLQNSVAQAKEKTLYRFFDEYRCNYLFLRLPCSDQYFFIGPYLLSLPSDQWIREKLRELGLPQEMSGWMSMYYSALPLIEDENFLLTMANTLSVHLWGAKDQYSMEYVDYAIHDRYEPVPFVPVPCDNFVNSIELEAFEQHYVHENELIEAVSKGKLHLVTAVAATVFNNGAENRLNDSLRDRKNNLIILKTLLRKAVEYGGVHPWHIHTLSSQYASRIENCRTIKQSFALQEQMIRNFCLLVKQHSLSSYSHYVGRVITLVQYDLAGDLRLKTIAERLQVNSSYLSRLFHREYGCTLTHFINSERMNRAMILLHTSEKSVQDIAAECGIPDVSYFIKLFKKHSDMTPSCFRESHKNAL